jgi:putative peptidoglycan lipid II flippase
VVDQEPLDSPFTDVAATVEDVILTPAQTAAATDKSDAAQAKGAGRAVAKATAGIGALHLLRLLVGFIAQPLIANRLGLRWQADAYAASTEIVRSMWIVFEKIVNPTVLPNFVHALADEGEERAWRLVSTALWLTVLVLSIVVPLSYIFMPWIVDIYSPRAGAEERELTIAMSRLLLSGLFFLSVSSLTYVILNGYKRFGWAALGDTLWKVAVALAAMWAVTRQLDSTASLYVLSWGFVIGAFLKLLPHVLALGAKWKLLRPKIDWRDPLAKKMLWLAIPLCLGILTSELRGVYLFQLADKASAVEGSRAALKFSKLIGDNLIQIFPYALSIGIFPYLADMARHRDRQPFTDTLLGALRVCIWVFAPLTAILIAVHYDLLRAVWQSGNMTTQDVVVMSLPFIAFTLGLIGFACENLLNQTFYAMTNAWTPTLIGLGTTVLWVLTAMFGVQYGMAAGLGLAAIAGAESLAKTVKCLVMWFMLRRHLGDIHAKENLQFLFKVLCVSLLAAMVSYFVVRGIAPQGELVSKTDKLKLLLAVAFSGMAGTLVYLLVSGMLGLKEARNVLEFGLRFKRRLKR